MPENMFTFVCAACGGVWSRVMSSDSIAAHWVSNGHCIREGDIYYLNPIKYECPGVECHRHHQSTTYYGPYKSGPSMRDDPVIQEMLAVQVPQPDKETSNGQ